jgi:hypothetical protein
MEFSGERRRCVCMYYVYIYADGRKEKATMDS